MTIYDEVKNKLINFPEFRERKKRGDYLVILALRKCELEDKYKSSRQLTLQEMADVAKSFDTYRHEWDAVLRDYPGLQGKDYADKKVLVQQKQIEYGYEPSYHQNVKQLKMYA